MTTGNVTATSITGHSRSIFEDATAKILDSIGCKNIFTQELPPVTTTQEFTQLLQYYEGRNQPYYEGWFLHRTSFRQDDNALTNFNTYGIVHGMLIAGMAFHGSFEDSYKYIQDKTEELFWTLEKNKDLIGNSNIEYVDSFSSNFAFEQFGELYMYRSQTTINAHQLKLELNGRVYTS